MGSVPMDGVFFFRGWIYYCFSFPKTHIATLEGDFFWGDGLFSEAILVVFIVFGSISWSGFSLSPYYYCHLLASLLLVLFGSPSRPKKVGRFSIPQVAGRIGLPSTVSTTFPIRKVIWNHHPTEICPLINLLIQNWKLGSMVRINGLVITYV